MGLFVDGLDQGFFSVRSDFDLPFIDASWSIGADKAGTVSYFNGIIDTMAIYPRVLTASEALEIYQSASLPGCRWAFVVSSHHQGLRKDGGSVPAERSDPDAMLGPVTGDTAEGTFFSLGLGGETILEIDQPVTSGQLTIRETTWGSNPALETANVYAWNGGSWTLLGLADNQTGLDSHTSSFQWSGFASKRFQIFDSTDPADWDAAGDGFDVDGFEICGEIETRPLVSVNLSADKDTVFENESVILSWTSENAEALSIDGIGPVDPNGSVTVSPD